MFGVPYWNPTYEVFSEWWTEVLRSPVHGSKIVCLANPNTMNLAYEDPEYMRVLRQIDVFVNDGVGIRMASRMRGVHARYNFAGTDLMPRLFSELQEPMTAFFYGAREEINQIACDRITAKYPNVKIVGRMNGYVDPEKEALRAIEASGAELLMCALGQPRQEMFMVHHRNRLNVKLAVTCGGMFDFFAGAKPRAPKVMRTLGMEWFFRLTVEPRRLWRRYLIGNPKFLVRAIRHKPHDLRHASDAARFDLL